MVNTSIKKNFVMNIILTMSSFIFPLITFPYVSRVLLPVGTGKVSFAMSVINYFNMFAQLGIPTYGIKVCAQARDDKEELSRVTHELLFLNIAVGIATYLVLAFAILFVSRLNQEKELFFVVSVTILFGSVGMEWLYRGLELYTYITIRSLIFKAIGIIAMFLLVHAESDYVVYGGITVFAASASNLLNFCNAHRYIRFGNVGNYHIRRHIRPVLVFFFMSCATTVYTNLDTVMIGFMNADSDVGFYNAAVKIKLLLVSVVTSLGAVLLPRASYYIEHGMEGQFTLISRKALRFVLLIASPMVVFFMVFAKEGILLLSGEKFLPSVYPMRVIMPTVLLIGLTNILGIQMLIPLGKEKVVLKSEVAGAIVDLIINLLLIPKYRSTGAAIGTLVAEGVVLSVQLHALWDRVDSFFETYEWTRLMIGLLIALVASIWVKYISAGNLFSLLIAGICFFGGYMVFMFWQREELIISIWEQLKQKRN